MDFRENRKKKWREKGEREIYWGIWLGGFVEKKLAGFKCFLSGPTKMFSSQIWEKIEEKILCQPKTKFTPPFPLCLCFELCLRCVFFFFFSDFPSSFSIFLLFYHFNQMERHVLLKFFSFFFLEIKDGTFY